MKHFNPDSFEIGVKVDTNTPKPKHKRFYEVKGKYEFKLDRMLKKNLDILIDDLKQNDDALIIIVAAEGAGKTVFETQLSYYLAQRLKVKYGVDNVHFEGQTYMDSSLGGVQFQINNLDESRRALNKMRASSGSNVDFMNFLSECRSQNQVHVVVLPAFTDLEQYVAIHRVKMLISIEKTRDPKTQRLIRGYFNIWSTKRKWLLKKAWDGKYKEFPKNMRIHRGKFENVLCIDENEYNDKKESAKKERYESKKPELTEKQQVIYNLLKDNPKLLHKEIAEKVGITRSSISTTIGLIKKKGYEWEGKEEDRHLPYGMKT